jgi:enoyl-[acyl-carrier-protein] reductase (NADH)
MTQFPDLMKGKRGVALGVANNRSIAWGIAKACHAAGAQIALTWQGDALKKRVEPLELRFRSSHDIAATSDANWRPPASANCATF